MECGTALTAGCSNCGFVNKPNAKFCSECGTASGASTAIQPRSTSQIPDAVAERRLVTVLFADLVGFTPFAEERDAEDVRETLTRYFDLAREVVGRYGGTVEKFIGDAVMAVWGAPTAHEDDAERAVRAALDLVAAVTVLGPQIQARAGVLTGEAAVTVGATNQGMVAGDLVNTASRLQSVAPPGAVLVGEATRRAASAAMTFEAAGDQVLKGKQAPIPAWRALKVVAERGGRGKRDALEAPYVGRDDELRLLKDLLHATSRERRPRLISVIGPGGIGKSRLAWELDKYVDGLTEGILWHDGRSPAYGDGITFWALGEMVRGRARLRESDDEATTRAKVAEIVREYIPGGDREAIERALLVLLGFESGVDPRQLFGSWRKFLEHLASTMPVVMVFEDLHFADQGLLDFIDHVLEWSRNSPITILTLARPELMDKRPRWGSGKYSFTSIHLEPLSDAYMRQLLTSLVPGLPDKAAAAIVARADGIPLYAVETVRMLVTDGRLALDDGVYRPTGELTDIAVPETLTALIAARLDGLDVQDRRLIADAAVVGQSFAISALAAVSGVQPAAVELQLAGLVRRELVRQEVDPRSPEVGQYVFVQSLIREVAYNTLSKKDRKTRHVAAARYFESLALDEIAGALAGHYLAACRLAGEGAEKDALAVQSRLALRAAADRAVALGSLEQAISFLDQALDIATDATDRADLHERALKSAIEGVSATVVMRHAEEALAARRELGDREGIVSATADLARAANNTLANPTRALEIALPAWDEFAEVRQTEAAARLMFAIATAYEVLGRHPESMMWVERMSVVAERLDLIELIAYGMILHGSSMLEMGRPREGMVLIRGGHALAHASRSVRGERGGRTMITFYGQWDDPAATLEVAREGLEIARHTGSRNYGMSMAGNSMFCAIRVGEWDWAAGVLEEWFPADLSADAASAALVEFLADRAILTSIRGGDATQDIDQATVLRSTITDTMYEAYEALARGWAALSAGDFGSARTQMMRAVRSTSFLTPLAAPNAARASLWQKDKAGAAEALNVLGETKYFGQALGVDQATIEAGIAALQGRTVDALGKYREALRGWRSLGLAWDEALTGIDMVTLLDPTDPEVAAVAGSTRTILERLGAGPYLRHLAAAMAKTQTARTFSSAETRPLQEVHKA